MSDDERLGAIAYGLESYMVNWDTIPWDEVPLEMQGFKNEDGYPIGAGRHPKFGWFVLASGQGPYIVWTECGMDRLLREFEDFRELGSL